MLADTPIRGRRGRRYRVKGLAGIDFHAANPANENDDRVLDPATPKLSLRGRADGRPVLMGAMFLCEDRYAGSDDGGPLTVCAHHTCVSRSAARPRWTAQPPRDVSARTIDVPVTAEMIHIWIVPGAPEPFGDLDEAWKRAYLEATSSRP